MTEYSFDKNISDLYKYLTICAIEQRGDISLNGISKNPKKANNEDIQMLENFLSQVLKTNPCNRTLEFLKDVHENLNKHIFIHLTRDCQIIETKHHYVILTFKLNIYDYIYNIRFKAMFNQNINDYPIGNKKISVSYDKDSRSRSNNLEDHENDCKIRGSHIVSYGDGTYYRSNFGNFILDSNCEIIKNMNSSYLIDESLKLKPKLDPDACTLQ